MGEGGGGPELFWGALSGRTMARAVRPTTPSELQYKLPSHLQRGRTSRIDTSPGKARESRPNTAGGEVEGEGSKSVSRRESRPNTSGEECEGQSSEPESRRGSQMLSPKGTRVGSRPVSRQQSREGDSRPASRQGSLAKVSSHEEIEAWETEQ